MSAPRKVLQLGDCAYSIGYAPATVALRAAATLANGFAPLLDGYRRGKGGDFDRILAGVAETMADPALSKNLETLCGLLSPYTEIAFPDGRTLTLGGDHGVFDRQFAGKLDHLAQWLQASVEFNLGGFLDEAKKRLADAKAAAEKSKASPSTSPTSAASSG